MADVFNDQYLFRPTRGRGAITPADPMEVRLYGPNGQPIGVQDGALKVALWGSLVPIYSSTKNELITVTPGSSIELLVQERRLEFKEIVVLVGWDTAATDSTLIMTSYTENLVTIGDIWKKFEGTRYPRAVFGELVDRYSISVRNDSNSDRILNRYVIVGVR